MRRPGMFMLVALAFATTNLGQPARADERPPTGVETSPFVARQLLPQVHLLSTPEDYLGPPIGNITVVEQGDGFVVIDSGLTAANGRAIVRYITSRSSKPVKAVAITHWHNDHRHGISALRDAWPNVRIIATGATEAGMLMPAASSVGYAPDARFDSDLKKRMESNKEQMRKQLDDPAIPVEIRERIRKSMPALDRFAEEYRGTYIVLPTETFQRRLVLEDEEVPIELMYLGRANTDGDAVAWLPKQKLVATGDIVVAPYPYGFGSYPADWIGTIDKIKALGFATLIPGHGEPQRDSAYLDKLQKAIADIRSQVGPLAKQGLTLEEVRKKVDFTRTAALFGDSELAKGSFQGGFAAPMISSAYKEARGEPIIQGEGFPKAEYSHTPPKPTSKKHGS